MAEDVKKKKKKKKTTRRKTKTTQKTGFSKAPNLVIVESPTKARTINKYLGDDYVVEASMGHVRDLPRSKMGLDIDNGFEPQYVVIAKARKTVSHLKKLAQGKRNIYLAPDPDREGEAISWHLSNLLGESGAPIYRVVFNEITKDAIQEAFRAPRRIDQHLVDAQQARRVLDRVVGYNLSPLLWKKVGKGLSAGRVQSVALRFIVEREAEIRAFKPVEYWNIQAELSSQREEAKDKKFIAHLEKIGGEKIEIKTREHALGIKQELENLPYRVAKITTRTRQRKPQAPYTTSKLQQEAFTRLRFSAQKTMMLAQQLYEGFNIGEGAPVGLITYMRTDSVNVSKQAHAELVKYIGKTYGSEYLPDTPNVYKSKKQAQEAHEAIRPTSVWREPAQMAKFIEPDLLKLYELVWSKFTASQMKPAVDEVVSIEIMAGTRYQFKLTGGVNIFAGFLLAFRDIEKARADRKAEKGEEGEEDEEAPAAELPKLVENEPLTMHKISGSQHFTKPPPRFNDASLVKLLEDAGIGRPSTYAPTIQTLVARDYVNRMGSALKPTELGEIVVKLLIEHFADIMDVNFTAYVEGELDKIEEGALVWRDVVREFYGPFHKDLTQAVEKMKNVRKVETPTDHHCDVCGKPMVVKWGRFGKFIACTGFPDCKYTRSIPTGYRCPEKDCGGDLVRLQSKRGRSFYGCSNYPKCRYATNRPPKQESAEGSGATEESLQQPGATI